MDAPDDVRTNTPVATLLSASCAASKQLTDKGHDIALTVVTYGILVAWYDPFTRGGATYSGERRGCLGRRGWVPPLGAGRQTGLSVYPSGAPCKLLFGEVRPRLAGVA